MICYRFLDEWLSKEIDYPEEWRMDEFIGPRPAPIVVRVKDPMREIAKLFLNPEIMYGYQDQVHFKAFKKFVAEESELGAEQV